MGHGQPRKLRLTPVERDILWILEEAGEENLPTIINTLRAKLPHLSEGDLRGEVAGAIEGLSRRGFVRVSEAAGGRGLTPVALTEAGRDTLGR